MFNQEKKPQSFFSNLNERKKTRSNARAYLLVNTKLRKWTWSLSYGFLGRVFYWCGLVPCAYTKLFICYTTRRPSYCIGQVAWFTTFGSQVRILKAAALDFYRFLGASCCNSVELAHCNSANKHEHASHLLFVTRVIEKCYGYAFLSVTRPAKTRHMPYL
jgi:hypothetical protein